MSLDMVAEVRDSELEAAERDRSGYPCDDCGSRHGVAWFDERWLCVICRARESARLTAEAYKRWR